MVVSHPPGRGLSEYVRVFIYSGWTIMFCVVVISIYSFRLYSNLTPTHPSPVQSPAYTLVWTRKGNGKLPNRAMDFNGILTIQNVRPEDAGIYVCTGSNMFAMDEGNAILYVPGSWSSALPSSLPLPITLCHPTSSGSHSYSHPSSPSTLEWCMLPCLAAFLTTHCRHAMG